MKLSKIKLSRILGIFFIPFFATIPMLVVLSPTPAFGYHKTNKPEVRLGLSENDGGNWIVIYSKEFSHQEYLKLTAAIAADVVTADGGAVTTAYFSNFAVESLNKVLQESAEKAPSITDQIRRELTLNKVLSGVKASFKGGTVDLSIGEMKFQVGNVSYNRAECTKLFGKKHCISTPNTHQPYIRFKVLQSQPTPPPTTGGTSDSRPSYSDLRLQTGTALHPTDSNFEFGVLPNGDVVAIKKSGASNSTEIHILDAGSNYQKFKLQTGTALHPTDSNFEFGVLPNGDVVAIKKSGASNSTEIHILDAGSNYQKFKLQTGTALHPTDSNFEFGVLPNGDVVAIKKSGASNSTEIHILDAGSNYQKFKLQTGTALHPTDSNFEFGVLPNGDVVAIKKSGASNSTEIHILDAGSNYQKFKLQTGTALHPTDSNFEFGVLPNGDVVAIKKAGGASNSTEIHILKF